MISAEILPQHYKRGLIVPIPKARKDAMVTDNTHGITLLSVLYKLLEMIILEREKEWLERSNVIDDLQGAVQGKCSSLHVSMLLQEAISYSRNKGNSVYIAFLDIRKAFVTVWAPGLLFKLSQLGMNRKALRFVFEGYKNFQCSVMIDGSWDSWFLPERGVHQGAPLSMRLYQVCVNELLQKLKSNTHGLMIDNINVTCPSFADDIATGALYKSGLNSHLALAQDYSVKWHSKSVWMLWGEDTAPSIDVKLGDRILQQVNSYKHMGITLCNDAALERLSYAESIGEARSSLLAARGIGSSGVPVPASILSKLYWSVSMPRLTYGLEVKTVHETALYDLERAYRQNAKIVENLPQNTVNPAPLATIGWISIESHLAIMKICFLLRILCLQSDNVYWRVAIYLLNSLMTSGGAHIQSHIANMFAAAKRYRIDDPINAFMRNDNAFRMYVEAKMMVKRVVWKNEYERWKDSCLLYKELSFYMVAVNRISIHQWWKLAKSKPQLSNHIGSVMSVLCGGQPRGSHRNMKQSICQICDLREDDDSSHVLFVCPALNNERDNSWERVKNAMPPALASGIDALPAPEKVTLLLSCWNSNFLLEWTGLYVDTVHFVISMYMCRAEKYDLMDDVTWSCVQRLGR